jgi:hypothetical protein
MIRPFTLLCFCAFATAGAWLYQVKHAVAMKDRELVEIRRETESARQRIDILRAEWALLNEPDRLRQTASRVLTLEPMQPQHFARVAEFERRLPAAVAFAGVPDLFAVPAAPEAPRGPVAGVMLASAPVVAPVPRAAAPAPAPAAAPVARLPETPAPQALAAAIAAQRAEQASRAAQAAPQALAPRPARPAPQPAPPQVGPATAPAPAPAPGPARSVQPAVHVVPAAPAAEPPTRVTRSTGPETTVASALGGSALGGVTSLGRPMLAPPVPIGQAQAATLSGPRAPVPAR